MPRGSSAWWSRPTSRCPAPARRGWTSCSSRPATSSSAIRSSRSKFTKQIAFNVHPAHRQLPRRRLDQGGVEDGGRDQEDPRSEDQGAPPPACACRCSSATREAVNVEFENEITAERGARHACARRRASMVVDKREDGGYVTPVECVGEDATYRQPHPQGPDGRARPVALVRRPTICARAPRSTRCRSPSCSAAGTCRRRPRPYRPNSAAAGSGSAACG